MCAGSTTFIMVVGLSGVQFVYVITLGQVLLRINCTRVFKIFQNCPSRESSLTHTLTGDYLFHLQSNTPGAF